MAKQRRYKCPECEGVFSYLHHPNVDEDPAPRFCPLCGFDSLLDKPHDQPNGYTTEVTAPHIQKSAIVKGADYTYRAMEEASEANMHAAAEAAGVDVSEMRSLKITDMKDGLREGDVAAMPVNPSSQAIEAAPGAFGFQPAQQGAGFAASAHTGAHAYAGLGAATSLRAAHSRLGGTVVDMPALEVQARQAQRVNPALRRGAGR